MEFLYLLAIPLLIAVNALFVAVEFALVSVRKTRVEEMVQQKLAGAKSVKFAFDNIDRSIATSQLGITIASIAIGAVGEPVLARLIEPLLGALSGSILFITKHGLATTVALICITLLHVVLGEQVPKLASLQAPDRTALWLCPPLNFFSGVMNPLIILMNAVGNFLLRLFGYKAATNGVHIHSIQELRMLIDETEDAGLIDAESADYVQNVFELRDKKVRECMVPIEKMDALELHSSSEAILEFVRSCGHTRIPVYDGTRDNIIGILNTKNLFYFFSLMNAVVLDDALYPVEFLRADELISNALRELKKTKVPMAIVRDENKMVVGMITLEDIIEEIVGDIEDEHDGPTMKLRRVLKKPTDSGASRSSVQIRPHST
ncbi:HlyC/CorC family transporter [Telmatocola sphagniphila]|uniref:HlyC/CorC family transporter n=1 Tax=Telmatocola sphagniphila TaxID=1123043 RepID=A0A8E6B634_9BACT|nr:hemolysin family protein [Telmatocola sphagniphila]QVL32057.1 HlyC/CorC family transporter [Telmatocola sphagniphila]